MTNKKYAIYGASIYAKVLFNELCRLGINVDFFVDEYVQAKEFLGKPVFRIKDVTDKKNLILMNATAYDLVESLMAKGFPEVKSLKETIYAYPGALIEFNQTMWVVKSNRLVNENEFAWLHKRMADEKSKKLLQTLTNFRMNPLPEYFFYADGDTEYFPSGFDAFKGIDNLKFVDCGAFTGDTIQSLFNNFSRKIEWIISMEPDPNNLEKLIKQNLVRRPEHENTNIFIYPIGAFNKETLCSFQLNGSSSSISDSSSDTQLLVPVARIDTLLAHTAPNFIKMDVEGAELEALDGAKEIIKKHRPNLAISAYHKAEHLWEVPRFIDSLCPDYEFRLRLHGNWGHELTLYCCMPE
ncbi:MAG: FkbM family methyltransferase [Candidatus Riflebacteria bacterium]|nr:FkbM family methyltransferase [Candidatus Riflebacteria bacterium]